MKKLLPFIFVFTLIGLLGWELFFAKPNEIPSPLIGENVPEFLLPNLYNSQPPLDNKTLSGHVCLLNVWASWCYACANEHEMLMKIKNTYHIPIYSIVYKDDTRDAIEWLKQKGNPYTLIGNDHSGDVAIDFGVYGTPETFVINSNGKIIYKHIGALTQNAWDNIIYPLIKQLSPEHQRKPLSEY